MKAHHIHTGNYWISIEREKQKLLGQTLREFMENLNDEERTAFEAFLETVAMEILES